MVDKTHFVYLYKIHEPSGDKYYIGQSHHGANRFGKAYAYTNNPKLFDALTNNPFDAIILKDNISLTMANKWEIFFIKQYNSMINGYNTDPGGNGLTKKSRNKLSKKRLGTHLSDETKQKISIKETGKKLSEETKRKLSLVNKGRHLSEETKKKISESHKGRHLSEEAKKKLSLYHKGKNTKKILQYSKDNELIQCWNSAIDIYNKLNIHCCDISQCCKGKRKSAGGYIWKYAEENK